jgi:hypothetical protein
MTPDLAPKLILPGGRWQWRPVRECEVGPFPGLFPFELRTFIQNDYAVSQASDSPFGLTPSFASDKITAP